MAPNRFDKYTDFYQNAPAQKLGKFHYAMERLFEDLTADDRWSDFIDRIGHSWKEMNRELIRTGWIR